MLQSVAVCCRMLQYVAVCCSMLQYVAVCCSVLQSGIPTTIYFCTYWVADSTISCSGLQRAAASCSGLQLLTVCCSVLNHIVIFSMADSTISRLSSTKHHVSLQVTNEPIKIGLFYKRDKGVAKNTISRHGENYSS